MPDRDWFFFSTIGLVLVAGLAIAGSVNHSREHSGQYEAAKQEYDSAHNRIAKSATARQSLIADIEAYRQEWREEQDLQAQQDMAKWAWFMMIVSLGGVSITAVGVVFVARTLIATREAVAAANRTADEAKRIGEAQVRGYLSSDGGKYWMQDRFLWFELAITNRGQSPFFGGETNGTLTIVEKGEAPIQRKVMGTLGALGANETKPCWLHVMNESLGLGAVEALKGEKGATVVLNLTLRWKDVFGVELWATYLFTQKDPSFIDVKKKVETYVANLDAFCVAANWGGKDQHF